MKFHLAELTEEHGRAISGWHYEPPFDIYNLPSWDWMFARQYEFADPKIRQAQYAAVLADDGQLAGFAQFFPLCGVIRLGLGLHPALCGCGLGVALVEAIVAEAARRRPGDEIDLEVLTWNERARKVYERAGFMLTDTYTRGTPAGPAEFHCMVYQRKHHLNWTEDGKNGQP